MRTTEDIVSLYLQRRRDYMATHTQMEHIQRVYMGETEIDLPDMDKREQSYVPNLLQTGIDQMAGRIASTTPMATFTIEGNNRRAERLAETRRRVVTGWWATDRVPNKTKTRARHLIAYSNSPCSIHWDNKNQRPTWNVRNPLAAYPSPDLIPGVVTPTDVIFSYTRTWAWCKQSGYSHLAGILPAGAKADALITIIEYHDHDESTLIGYAEQGRNPVNWAGGTGGYTVLETVPNVTGLIPATIPSRISLEPSGQFDGMVGMYYAQAKLMALEVLAVERAIFPDTYLEGRAGETPKIVAGPYDGRSGDINVVSGGIIKDLTSQPGYSTNQTIDRLERAQRLTAGIPAEFGGESPTNIRTGRRGDSVMSATIDFPVAEAQEMLALALHDEDLVAIALSRYYNGMAPTTIYVGTGNARMSTTFIAEKTFDKDCDHTVTYPITGTDMNGLMIGLGQRVGLGTMSKETAAELDPYIENPESEHDRIISEGLEQALMSGLQQQASSGQIPPMVLSRVMTLVKSDRMELPEAITKATEEAAAAAQAKAEAEAADQPQTAEQMGAPAALAGLAGAQSPIPGATPGQGDLATLMSTLRKPAMTIQPLQGVAAGAQ